MGLNHDFFKNKISEYVSNLFRISNVRKYCMEASHLSNFVKKLKKIKIQSIHNLKVSNKFSKVEKKFVLLFIWKIIKKCSQCFNLFWLGFGPIIVFLNYPKNSVSESKLWFFFFTTLPE